LCALSQEGTGYAEEEEQAAGLLRACRLNAAACGLQQARAMTSEREAGRAVAKARPAPPRPAARAPDPARAGADARGALGSRR
jgi:hypothetical protein